MGGEPRIGETAKAIRGRGWTVHEDVPDHAVVVRQSREPAEGYTRFGVFEWKDD